MDYQRAWRAGRCFVAEPRIRRTALALLGTALVSTFMVSCQASSMAGRPSAGDAEQPEFAESAAPPPEPSAPLSDSHATRLLHDLSDGEPDVAQDAVRAVIAAGDDRFVAVFIELLRANQLGLVRGVGPLAVAGALHALTDQRHGGDWASWVEWYGATDLAPPPGFTGWKGELLGRIDPGFAEFLEDDAPSRIRVEEIVWGGVRVDGIPALDNATMIPAESADYLDPHEPVFGVSIDGDSRAYPLRIMDWHEMANDVVGGVPMSLAYCTLCGAGIPYDGRASDGATYTFGSSGFLYRSNKLMYDRQTRTLWNQLTGEPVLGELAGRELQLKVLPSVITTWHAWQAQHPDTLVLDINTGHDRPYIPGAPYGDYFSSATSMFPVWQRSDLLADKSRIFAINLGGVPKAYPLDILIEAQVVNDTVAGSAIVLVATRGELSVDGVNLRVGPVTYNAGAEVRAYDRGSETFTQGSDSDTVFDSLGRAWQVTEDALVGPEGRQAPRVAGHLAYWLGWFSFFPQTLVYGQP